MNKESEDTATIELRLLRIEDYKELRDAQIEAYAGMDQAHWSQEHVEILLNKFPQGQLCITVDGKVAASAQTIIVDYRKLGDSHTYKQATGDYTFSTHDPDGDVLYGIEIFVHPEYRGMRLGRRLYEARKELCENLNLRSIVAGGRIPNYSKYANDITPKDYIEKVVQKEIYDPTLTFQLSNGFHVKKVLKGYLLGDEESLEYATLLEWNNIYYQEHEKLINSPKSIIRVGIVQWQMRPFKDFDSFIDQVEFFVDAVSDYKSDFILFPEFFNAPLMSEYNHLGEAEAIRKLAGHTEAIKAKFMEFAVSYNINIICGSVPYLEDNELFNLSYLCRRDGSLDSYRKIHITPSEKSAWGMIGGDNLMVMDTDCGKIGILICYDVEFPELARRYAEEGMQVLFVPFQTDTQNGYMRVSTCAKARAIENECYVCIAGNVGNLPKVNNMDIQYAQSAVFTPSDFSFPNNAIKAEATPNTEMTLICDLDLDLLKELHTHGSVRTLSDRREDLYEVAWKDKS